jgi:hypothetical protein
MRESELRTSARVLREWEREITALRWRRTHWEREDLEERLAGGGWQLEPHWGRGTSLWANEGVLFFRIGVPVKQLRSQRKGMGVEREEWGGGGRESKISARSTIWSESQHQMLGKTLLTKKAYEKSLTSIEQSLMAGPNWQAGPGKDGTGVNLGQAWLL